MKKIILLVLILSLTGCYEDSGKLETVCINKENINSLYSETTYNISFKSDIIDEVEITYYYKDSASNTISSIKSSINTTDQYINNLNRTIVIDNDNEFKISYIVNSDDNKEILDKFYIQERRSNVVKTLEEKGFECK